MGTKRCGGMGNLIPVDGSGIGTQWWVVRPKPSRVQWACGALVICGVPDGTSRSETTAATAATTVNTV